MELVLPPLATVQKSLAVPELRIRRENKRPVNERGDFVLYWMIASRRTHDNFALDRAVEWANELDKPLLIFEPLRADYRWASDRIHQFVIDGMADNAASLEKSRARYYPFVARSRKDGKGLLEALAEHAAVIVTDHFPCFFLPRMVSAAAKKVEVCMESVDSNGLYPLAATEQTFKTARAFRTVLSKELPKHLHSMPREKPLLSLPKEIEVDEKVLAPILAKWPAGFDVDLSELPIDHTVKPVEIKGGMKAANAALKAFADWRLARYADRNHPDEESASGLSPYLHFGHISVHSIYRKLSEREDKDGFIDELVTWREVGFNMCEKRPLDYDRYESLPEWAQKTLAEHEADPRDPTYTLEELAESKTYDDLWNAAQNELRESGRMQNYLRMLWGKKILEWTRHPKEALDFMIELNNRYALDGRNPNSYTGIFWVLGRYDRPWAPKRPIFGAIRYMTSGSTKKKLKLRNYLARWS